MSVWLIPVLRSAALMASVPTSSLRSASNLAVIMGHYARGHCEHGVVDVALALS